MSRRPRILSEHDRDAWQSYIRHVKPLRDGLPPAPPPVSIDPTPSKPAQPVLASPVKRAGPAAVELVVGDRGLGLDNTSWRALSNGRLAPARRLDLHGHTANAAFAELHAFIVRASADRLRCVEIITGRGAGETGGVLRRELPHWLNRADLRPLIIAAQHPHPANQGAVRLLLRKRPGG
jgi:DNA-nicking Smr family endonuclease